MAWEGEYTIVQFVMLLTLPKGAIYWEADDLHNQWLELFWQEWVQYYDNRVM